MTDANQPPEATTADTAAPQDTVAPADPVEALTRENTELKDRLLRTLAEMENLRRRTERRLRMAAPTRHDVCTGRAGRVRQCAPRARCYRAGLEIADGCRWPGIV